MGGGSEYRAAKKVRTDMRFSSFIYFADFGIKTILFRKREPILGTVIVTDKCNLNLSEIYSGAIWV